MAKPVKLDIESPDHHSAPHLVDWDKDGDLDLISGTSSGGVLLSVNNGSRSEPKFGNFKQLVVAPSHAPSDSDTTEMSQATRVWATDFNNDGLMDLLVGDSASNVSRVEGLSDEEYEKLKSEYEENMKVASDRMQEFHKENAEVFEAMQSGKEMEPDLKEEWGDVTAEMSKAYRTQEKFQTTERTGYVWLLIQKPKSEEVAAIN